MTAAASMGRVRAWARARARTKARVRNLAPVLASVLKKTEGSVGLGTWYCREYLSGLMKKDHWYQLSQRAIRCGRDRLGLGLGLGIYRPVTLE